MSKIRKLKKYLKNSLFPFTQEKSLNFFVFQNFRISENNIIRVQAAKVIYTWYSVIFNKKPLIQD
jgi:hypothetical protein